MLKLILVTLACLCLTIQGASIEDRNSTIANSKRMFIQHGVPPMHPIGLIYPNNDYYYSWYNIYPTQFTVVPAVTPLAPACAACPSQCPGTCGTWAGLNTCQLNTCPLVGNPCNSYNIGRGFYLHPFSLDTNRYIQCVINPGVVYIRTCPIGLVFDHVHHVCSYPIGIVQYWNHYHHRYLQNMSYGVIGK